MNKTVLPDELIPALRQFRHNDDSGLVMALDIKEVVKTFKQADERLAYAELLAKQVRKLNPKAGELGEGKCLNMIALADKVLDTNER